MTKKKQEQKQEQKSDEKSAREFPPNFEQKKDLEEKIFEYRVNKSVAHEGSAIITEVRGKTFTDGETKYIPKIKLNIANNVVLPNNAISEFSKLLKYNFPKGFKLETSRLNQYD